MRSTERRRHRRPHGDPVARAFQPASLTEGTFALLMGRRLESLRYHGRECMSTVMAGRYTATIEGPFVVFIIGMRVNRFLAFRKWVPTAMAMGPMLKTLFQHPEKGFLGAETFFSGRSTVLIQYWRSFDDLERFARSKEEPHL